MKIPPRHLFICQVYGTALGSIVNFERKFSCVFIYSDGLTTLCVVIRGVINSKRGFLDGTLIDSTGQWSGRKPEIFMSVSNRHWDSECAPAKF